MIRVQGETVGEVEVFYREERPPSDEGPFLKEERKLIDTVAERLGQLLLQRRLLELLHGWEGEPERPAPAARAEWWIIVDFLRNTDPRLLIRISRRMINYLCWNGVAAAQDLLPRFTGARGSEESDDNRPVERRSPESLLGVADEAFRVASEHLSGEEIRSCMEKWIKDDMAGFLLRAAENQGTSTADLAQALGRFHDSHIDDRQLSRTIQVELRVSLARRFLTDDLAFVDVAKDYIDTADYFELARHVIAPPKSHGRVGGKSAGLLLATQIVRKSTEFADALGTIRIPKTWYLTSDGILDFIEYNQLEDLYNRKYLEIDQVRREYPHVIQVFKNSHFSPEIVKGLSLALDDFEDRPLIVRSSSLLEDRVGAAFSGKYKSLFLANQGHEGGAALGAPRRRGRGLRVGLRPRPARVPRGARPSRRPRGDGDPPAGGRGLPGRAVLPPDVRRRRILEQRVPLVGAHQARRRPRAARAGAGHAGRRPPRRRLSRPRGAGPAGSEGERHRGRDRPLLAPQGRRHRHGVRELRDDRGRAPPRRVRAPTSPGSSRSSPSPTRAASTDRTSSTGARARRGSS